MRRIILITYLFLVGLGLHSQNPNLDSLLRVVETDIPDTVKIGIYKRIGYSYQNNNQNKAIEYLKKALELSQATSRKLDEANCYYSLGFSYLQKSDFANSLDYYLQSIRIYESINDTFRLSNALFSVVSVYTDDKNLAKQNEYLRLTEKLLTEYNDSELLITFYNQRGVLFDQQGKLDSALFFLNKAEALSFATQDTNSMITSLVNSGLTYKHLHQNDIALEKFETAIQLNRNWKDAYVSAILYNNIGATYVQKKSYIQALEAFRTSIEFSRVVGSKNIELENLRNMADMYGDMQKYQNQVAFMIRYYNLKDSIFTVENKNQLTQLEADYVIEKKNLQLKKTEAELQRNTILRNIYLALIIAGIFILTLSVLFYQRIRLKNRLLESKNTLINAQKNELESALSDLKSTQNQLIQSEKMASLGELTAGIAHEIQNPLNFVNNFSEVNHELLDDLKHALEQNDKDEVEAILQDLQENETKIATHGKRAEAIVSGMLMHTRSSSGQKESTDINMLCDEYLRLSYHGFLAKDPNFSAEFTIEKEKNLPEIEVIPQDMGRVLLNLINNAFYAVNEKVKQMDNNYKPLVVVTTNRISNGIRICVQDNGTGIPENIKAKIFQPFYTTKPTGQGTGLGLSLSYDLIKAHGGQLYMESKPEEGTAFIIELPYTK